jgi:hypothetical protein
LKGLNITIISQLAKFWSVPDSAIPIAKPAAASIAIKLSVLTHKTQAADMKIMILSKPPTRLERKLSTIGSYSLKSISFLKAFWRYQTTLKPIYTVKSAKNILLPQSVK